MTWQLSARQAVDQVEAKYAATDYAKDTKSQVERDCAGKQAVPLRECITEVVKTSRESQRSEADLEAQRQAARWTMIAGGAAALGFALSVVGVYLVYTTFAATREANDIVREQSRAWITIEATAKKVLIAHEQVWFHLDFNLSNVGQGVAHNVILTFAVRPLGASKESKDTYFKSVFDGIDAGGSTGMSLTPSQRRASREFWISDFPEIVSEDYIALGVRPTSVRAAVHACARYKIVGDPDWKETRADFVFYHLPPEEYAELVKYHTMPTMLGIILKDDIAEASTLSLPLVGGQAT